MAGVKGRSGGPRPNSGGARPGAGRPKLQPVIIEDAEMQTLDPKEFLASLMGNPAADVRLRADAAKTLLMAELRMAEAKGKKEQKQEAAERASSRFAPSIPPKLRAVAGKKLG